jgi:hypothetical protein
MICPMKNFPSENLNISKRLETAINSFTQGKKSKNGRQIPTVLYFPELESKPFHDTKNFEWTKGKHSLKMKL